MFWRWLSHAGKQKWRENMRSFAANAARVQQKWREKRVLCGSNCEARKHRFMKMEKQHGWFV